MKSKLTCSFDNIDKGLVFLKWEGLENQNEIIRFIFDTFEISPQGNNFAKIPIAVFINASQELSYFANNPNNKIELFEVSEDISNFFRDIPSYNDAISSNTPLKEEDVQKLLDKAGFKRKLKDIQIRNVAKVANLPAFADFSVPGAGKTTEALAVFTLNKKNADDRCLVVSPKNAFTAWEEDVPACLGTKCKTTILSGDSRDIRAQLRTDASFFLVNYELIRSRTELVNDLANEIKKSGRNFYIIADESHRMKAKEGSTAKAMSYLAPLSKYKIILTGTPCPQEDGDLISQFKFLYPKEYLTSETDMKQKFEPIFVRTTKKDLEHLLPKIRETQKILPLTGVFAEVYQIITNEAKKRKFNFAIKADLRAFQKIVIKLIRFCSNPQLVLSEIYEIDPELGEALAEGGLGPKLQGKECLLQDAKKLINNGEKVLIWSSFPKNIDVIYNYLESINANPVKIHGSIPMGDEDTGFQEPGTRRHAIYNFQNNPECMAFIANPAAAGEGISLHKVCNNALYCDRSYNVAHYLQSKDRIHRIGGNLEKEVNITVYMIRGTIDERISVGLQRKIQNMSDFLGDPSIIPNFYNNDIDFKDKDDVHHHDAFLAEEIDSKNESRIKEDCDFILEGILDS